MSYDASILYRWCNTVKQNFYESLNSINLQLSLKMSYLNWYAFVGKFLVFFFCRQFNVLRCPSTRAKHIFQTNLNVTSPLKMLHCHRNKRRVLWIGLLVLRSRHYIRIWAFVWSIDCLFLFHVVNKPIGFQGVNSFFNSWTLNLFHGPLNHFVIFFDWNEFGAMESFGDII